MFQRVKPGEAGLGPGDSLLRRLSRGLIEAVGPCLHRGDVAAEFLGSASPRQMVHQHASSEVISVSDLRLRNGSLPVQFL